MDVSLGIVFGAIAMLSWGASDFFVTKSARGAGPFKSLLWSQLIALAVMSPVFLMFFKLPSLSVGLLALILFSGLLTVVSNLSFFKSLQVGKVSVVMPVASCWAIVTVALSTGFLHEVLTAVQSVGVSLAIIGAVLVSFRWKDLLGMKSHAKGVTYAIIAALAFGTDFVVIDMMVGQMGWFLPIFFIGGVTAAFLLLYSGATKKDIVFPRNILLFVVLVGMLDTVAYLSYAFGVTSEYGSIVAPIAAASPAVSIVLARIFFRERTELNQKVGIVAVLASLVMLSL